jgi:CO/xanthine dehydrogenase Mo-binding subunit
VNSIPRQEVVGGSVQKIDACMKATGEAKFGGDIYLPGMLFGKILRSKLPHGRIRNIDTSKAEKLPGVKAVVTWKDAPDIQIGMYTNDWRFFAKDKVRYRGDVVAAVAATDLDIAGEALELIQVDYEELPGVFDPLDAMQPGAPLVHESIPQNVLCRRKIRKGDPEKVFLTCSDVFEDTFKTQMVEHCSIETHAAVAQFDHSGKVTIWSSTQAPFNNRVLLARGLQMQLNKVRIITTHVGGAFGGKQDLMVEPSCVLLSKKSGRAVRMVIDREEEFTASTVRHPFVLTYKTAVDRKGRILARKINLVQDLGAYNDLGEGVLRYAVILASGPYNIEHVWVDGVCVYTNQQVGGVMRGIGVSQACFAGESQIDVIAEAIGLDPFEFRLRNALKDGDVAPNGQRLVNIGFEQTLRAVVDQSGYASRKKREHHGFGMASMMYTCGIGGRRDYSGAVVRVNEDGTVTLMIGVPDVGQGVRTTLAQICAQELGVRYEDVWVDQPDTDYCPVDFYGSNASRITYVAGNAVKSAAAKAKERILEGASRKWGAAAEDLLIVNSHVYRKGVSDPLGSLKELVMEMHRPHGETIISSGTYQAAAAPVDHEDPERYLIPVFTFATQLAEVELEPDTGKVRVLRIWAANDVGKAVNPVNVEGQVEGGIQIGLGFALSEEILRKQGQTLNASFSDYKIFTSADMPMITPIIIEVPEPTGPFGARGVAESTTIPTAGAIANAVADAAGVRIHELPLSPERVLAALKKCRKTRFGGKKLV